MTLTLACLLTSGLANISAMMIFYAKLHSELKEIKRKANGDQFCSWLITF